MSPQEVKKLCCRWAHKHMWVDWEFELNEDGTCLKLKDAQLGMPGDAIPISPKYDADHYEGKLLDYVAKVRSKLRDREARLP